MIENDHCWVDGCREPIDRRYGNYCGENHVVVAGRQLLQIAQAGERHLHKAIHCGRASSETVLEIANQNIYRWRVGLPGPKRAIIAFDDVMSTYKELASICYLEKACDIEKMRERSKTQRNPKVVRPSPSDFIADVFISARHVLKNAPVLWTMFQDVWVSYQRSPDVLPTECRDVIQTYVGRNLIRRGIWPCFRYFRPVRVG